MTDREFDELLGRALAQAAMEDLSPVLTEAEETQPRWSRRYLRRREQLLADPFGYARRAGRPMWQKAVRAALCAALIAVLALGAAMAVSPGFRYWVQEQTGVSTTIRFQGSQTGMADPTGWRPTKLPKGYEESEVSTREYMEKVTYRDQEGKRLLFECFPIAEGFVFNFDNEHSDQSELTLNRQTAYLFDSSTGGKPSALLWFSEDGTLAFELMGWMSGEDLVSVAKSVKKVG